MHCTVIKHDGNLRTQEKFVACVFYICQNKINKSLYLSVNVFSTAVLIEDTVNSETNIINQTETC